MVLRLNPVKAEDEKGSADGMEMNFPTKRVRLVGGGARRVGFAIRFDVKVGLGIGS